MTIDSNDIEESSQVLNSVQRANKVTNFRDSSRRERVAPAVESKYERTVSGFHV
jgi:hypothetical protein